MHGHGTYIYMGLPPLKTGANFTCECIWRTILKIHEKYRTEGGVMPPILFVQLDSSSDNKAYVVLAFMSFLIEKGIFKDISLNFLLVGHTHEDIGRVNS